MAELPEGLVRKLKKAAKEAIIVQDACNMAGVARAFEEILTNTLWPCAHMLGTGTDWVNHHPITVLFSDKIADLAGLHREVGGNAEGGNALR